MRTRHLATAVTLSLLLAVSIGPADAAKVCKDAVSAKARSAAQLSDASRETPLYGHADVREEDAVPA